MLRLKNSIASTAKITKVQAAQELMALSKTLTAKANMAEVEAHKAIVEQKTTVQAERAVTSRLISALNVKNKAAIEKIKADNEHVRDVNKKRASAFLQSNQDLHASTAKIIASLKETISTNKIEAQTEKRDVRKEMNTVIRQKNLTIAVQKKETSRITENAAKEAVAMKHLASTSSIALKRLATSVTKQADLSAKRQRKVVDATKTVSSLRDGMETMKSETQIQLDDAQLSVDALTADNVNLKNQVKQLQHDCADAVEELEVSIFFITIFISD